MKKSKRSLEQELLDLGPSYYTKAEYQECLKQLARIGNLLGGDEASLKTLKKLSRVDSILDVGCGGGQFAILLAKHFSKAQILGVDVSSEAIAFAKNLLYETSLKNIKFEISSPHLPFPPNSFDVVTSTLVCHHLTDNQLVDFLKKTHLIARKCVVINDLHRHWLAYSCFRLIAGIFFPNRLIFHDGLLSIKRAFKRKDWINYLNAAEIPLEHCSITWHWAFRWIVRIDSLSKSSS